MELSRATDNWLYGKPAGYSLRICLMRAIASSTPCSGVMPSLTTWWISLPQTCSASTWLCRQLPERARYSCSLATVQIGSLSL
jgi:hypothetical protein